MPNRTVPRVLRAAATLALGLGLGACAAGQVSPAYVGGSYDTRTLDYIASKGSLHTRVVGDPFGGEHDRLAKAVTGSMFGAHSGQRVRFSAEPDPASPSPYFVVVMFNPGPGVSAGKLCREPEQPSAAAGGGVRVLMALCAGGDYENYVSGRLPAAAGPDDPALRALLRQMTAQLFPPRNPDPQEGLDFDI